MSGELSVEEAVEGLVSGELRLYEVEAELGEDAAVEARRRAMEERHGLDLSAWDGELTGSGASKNVENMVGSLEVPMGVVPGLEVDGEFVSGEFDVPLATTEGALVASVSRGAAAISRGGGATVRVTRDGMTRAPVFRTSGIEESLEVLEWLEGNRDALDDAVATRTSHGELQGFEGFPVGRNLFLRLRFDTKDAMGMNMVTSASEAVADLLEEELGVHLVSLSGNVCTDKKPAAVNYVNGRGSSVSAEARVPGEAVEEVLKCTPEAVEEVNSRKNLVGSARAGAMGFNAHHANMVASLFLATGQDEAHVVGGSTGLTTAEATDEGLYFSVTLPSIQVGTVGGGTRLPGQRRGLEMLGLAGGGDPPGVNAKGLAEVAGATVLAGELSLLGALASGHLSRAHEELGR